MYAPSGTANKKERMELFNELATHLLTMGRNKLPVMAGDWNVILAECDTTRNFQSNLYGKPSSPGDLPLGQDLTIFSSSSYVSSLTSLVLEASLRTDS